MLSNGLAVGRESRHSTCVVLVCVCYCSFVSLSRVSEFEFRRHTECQQVEDRMAEPLQLVLYLLCWCIFTKIAFERQDLSFDRSPFRTPQTPRLQNWTHTKLVSVILTDAHELLACTRAGLTCIYSRSQGSATVTAPAVFTPVPFLASQVFSCWYDSFGILEAISRKAQAWSEKTLQIK